MNDIIKSEDCNHCFHQDGTSMLIEPPRISLLCCWCGYRASAPMGEVALITDHGLYLNKINPNVQIKREVRFGGDKNVC